MEPQVTICCKKNKTNNCCAYIVLGLLFSLFLATLGLILGAVFAETLLAAIAALIVLAVVLLILVLVTIIKMICCKEKKNC